LDSATIESTTYCEQISSTYGMCIKEDSLEIFIDDIINGFLSKFIFF
jgi:hypothetical protein